MFLLDKYQTKANIERIKLDKTATSRRAIKDCIKALTIVFKPKIIKHLYIYIYTKRKTKILPGTTATVFNARSTRNVRNTATFPKLIKNVTYL